ACDMTLRRILTPILALTALSSLLPAQTARREPAIHIATPMPPPAWALLERELLRYTSLAVERFAARYVDERGYLAHTPRWGTLDGPDDAIETFWNWTLLHALGGARLFLRGQERPRLHTRTLPR